MMNFMVGNPFQHPAEGLSLSVKFLMKMSTQTFGIVRNSVIT